MMGQRWSRPRFCLQGTHGLMGRHISEYSIMHLISTLGGGTSHGLGEGSPEKVTRSKVLQDK